MVSLRPDYAGETGLDVERPSCQFGAMGGLVIPVIIYGGLVLGLVSAIRWTLGKPTMHDDAYRDAELGLAHTHVRCHCGHEGTIAIPSNSGTGWYQCDCGCAWRYMNLGNGIQLVRAKNCASAIRTDDTMTLDEEERLVR
jgi:hypothetical protein